MKAKRILGVKVDLELDWEEVISKVAAFLGEDCSHYICTTNPEFIMTAQKDFQFKKIVNESALSLPDGVGVLYAARYLDEVGKIKKDRLFPVRAFLMGMGLGFRPLPKEYSCLTGVGLTHALCDYAARHGKTVFLLGGWPRNSFGTLLQNTDIDVASMAAEKLCALYPGLKIVGATSQYSCMKDKEPVGFIHTCMSRHNISHIDFLFVAFGHVRQEEWIVRNASKLPARISLGVGGTFDYIAGIKKEPSAWVQSHNLGWLYRLVMQPWRWRRIFTAFPLFPLKVYLDSLKSAQF